MNRIYAKPVSLHRLRRFFERRIFAVPELQREFVWNARKTCDLLDSLYHGYPIGNALVWKTDRRDRHLLRSKLHILPPFDETNKEIWFLIDGQQRLSVLWQILRGSGHEITNAKHQVIDFSGIYFNAGRHEGGSRFLYRKKSPSKDHIAVVDLLSHRWRGYASHLARRASQNALACRKQLLNYELWLTFIETAELPEVRETFIRINSLGTSIGTADRAFARAVTFNLRHLVRELKGELSHGFDKMSEEALLTTAALAMGKSDLGRRAIDAMITDIEGSSLAATSFRRLWPRLRQAVGHAIDYLVANFGVANHGFLPSENLVAVLALFFLHNNNRRPSRVARDQLRRWFWATVVGTRYTGRGFRPNILADAQLMERLALKARAPFKTTQRTPLYMLRHSDYSRRSMLTDGYFCLLRLHRPRYLEDGEELPSEAYSTRANRHDKHHIFPRQQLANRGLSSSEYNCVANICFLVARENQSIGSKQPRSYLEELPQGRRQMIRALRSHLIPFDKNTGLWDPNLKRGFKKFIAQRALLISRAFEEQAGMKLFSRD